MNEKTVKKSPERLIVAIVLLATALAFSPVFQFDFLAYDDEDYVSRNEALKDGFTLDALKACFTEMFIASWQPLAMLSHTLDIELFGMNAGLHHLVSVLFHLLNVAVLYSLLRRLTGAPLRSAFVAGLFALHPFHVESVAWISSRKDLLSALFTFATIAAYMWYVKRPSLGRYVLMCIALVLAFLGKPTAVTVPILLLLLDYWPLKRLETLGIAGKRIVEKVPLFILAGIHSLITYAIQNTGGAVNSLELSPLTTRLALIPTTYVSYVAKTLWPHQLGPFYPNPYSAPPVLMTAGAIALLVSITLGSIALRKRYPYAIVGWFWFLLSLVPVIGLIPFGSHLMADRYTYISIIGLFLMLVWGAADLLERVPHKKLVGAMGILATLVLLTTMTARQVLFWRDDMTLFSHSLSVSGPNYLNHLNLGHGYFHKGAIDEALHHYDQAVKFRPTGNAFTNIGTVYIAIGRYDIAKKYFELSLEYEPDNPIIQQNVESVHIDLDRIGREIGILERTVATEPENAAALLKLGKLLSEAGQLESASQAYTKAIALGSDTPEAHANLGEICIWRGRNSQAIDHLMRALTLDQSNRLARFNLADALEKDGRIDRARAEFERLLEIEPNSEIARIRLKALATSFTTDRR